MPIAILRAVRRFLFTWLPVFLLALALGVLVLWGAGTFRLAREHTHTQGVSLGPAPTQHGQSLYRFTAGLQTYRSEGSRGHGYIPAGEPVTVFYVAANPQISCLEHPGERLFLSLAAVLFCALLSATVFSVALAFLPVFVTTMVARPKV